MEVYGLQTSIWQNRLRLLYLMALIPFFVAVVIAIYAFLVEQNF